MSDGAWAGVSVWRTTGRESEIASVLRQYGFVEGSHGAAGLVREGAAFEAEYSPIGVFTELGPDLERVGVVYDAYQYGDGESYLRRYTPELGVFEGACGEDGRGFVDTVLVSSALTALTSDDPFTRATAIERLHYEGGVAWDRALAAERAKLHGTGS